MGGQRRGRMGGRRWWTPRWRRHGVVRPTIGGVVAMGVDAALWYAGLLLDDRSLMAAAVTVTLTLLCAVAATVVQWVAVAPASRLPRSLAPAHPAVRLQVERLDQDGAVVSRHVGRIPVGRGLYRHASAFVHWVGPFGLFAASRVLPRGGETVVPPEADRAVGADRQGVDRRSRGRSSAEDSGQVRPYAPGDPPKLISWKATARHDELMTRETARDTRPTVVVVLDVRGTGEDDAMPDERTVDAMASRAFAIASDDAGGARGDRLVVTDGRRVADTTARIRRFLAAVMPIGQDRVQRRDAARRRVAGAGRADGSTDVAALASCVERIVAQRSNVSAVLLLTASPQGPLAMRLRRRLDPDRLHVVDMDAGKAHPASADDGSARGAEADGGETSRTEADAVGSVSLETAQNKTTTETATAGARLRQAVPAALAGASSLTLLALALASLTGLISGVAWWPWFASLSLGAAVVAALVPHGSRCRLVLRLALFMACDALAATVAILIRARDAAGSLAGSVLPGVGLLGNDPGERWSLTADVVAQGWDALIAQLPPVDVDPAGDAALILVFAAGAAALRLMLVARGTMPALAGLTVLAFAADYALLGHQTAWWRIALAIVAFLTVALTGRPALMPRWTVGIPMVAVVTVVSLALTPSAVRLANAVPLSIGDSTGLLSANTINPVVDLKRSLKAGSNDVVLTYRSPQRTYLRMTTLDRFDGDSWRFDEAIAKDGNFYGSGIQFGRDATDGMEGNEWQQWRDNPLLTYTYLLRDQGYDLRSGSGTAPSTGSAGGSQSAAADWMLQADVTIDTLRTRFLPVPGTTVMRVSGAGDDWVATDTAIYNRDSVTAHGMEYTAGAIGFDPITHGSGFTQLEAAVALRDAAVESMQRVSTSWNERAAARARAVTDGLGTQHRQWLVVPFTLTDDGTAVDAFANTIGRVPWMSSSPTDANQGALGGIRLSTSLRERLAVGDDETVGVLMGGDGTYALAVRMNDEGLDEERTSSSEGDAGWEASSGQAPNELSELRTELGYRGLMVDTGTRSNASQWGQSALARIDQLDTEAGEEYLTLAGELPESLRAVVNKAEDEGVAVGSLDRDRQIAAMRWLVGYFTDPDNGFTYSLDAPDGDGRSNMAVIGHFLENKAGYCVHYASALAILARAMGVPTRMVMGYNKGVGKAVNGAYEVRAKQLHAWVEAWIDGVGWVPFDVTPATSENGSAASDESDEESADSSETVADDQADVQDDAASGDDAQSDGTDAAGMQEDGQDAAAQQADGAADASNAPSSVSDAAAPWVSGALWAVAVALAVVALLLLPRAVRVSRRRRRMHGIAMSSPHACALAVDELYDAAWDAGVRWDDSCTDRMIAGRIAAFAPSAARDARWVVDAGMRDAFAAGEAMAGVDMDRAETDELGMRLGRACASLADAGRASVPWAGLIRFLFPASLRRR